MVHVTGGVVLADISIANNSTLRAAFLLASPLCALETTLWFTFLSHYIIDYKQQNQNDENHEFVKGNHLQITSEKGNV